VKDLFPASLPADEQHPVPDLFSCAGINPESAVKGMTVHAGGGTS